MDTVSGQETVTLEIFTACPHCEAVFRLTQDKLNTKEGLVRCGACREIFNAKWNLVEKTEIGFRSNQPDPALVETIHQVTGDPSESGQEAGGAGSSDTNERPGIQADRTPSVASERPDWFSEPDEVDRGQQEESQQEERVCIDGSLYEASVPTWQNETESRPVAIETDHGQAESADSGSGVETVNVIDSEGEAAVHSKIPDAEIEGKVSIGEFDSDETRPANGHRSEPVFGPVDKTGQDNNDSIPAKEDSEQSDLSGLPELEMADSINLEKLSPFGYSIPEQEELIEISEIPHSTIESSQPVSHLSRINIDGVDHYIGPRSNPLISLLWFMVTVGFLVLLGLQVKYFFVEKYAQHEDYRRYLAGFCKIADCELPPRQDLFRFTLTHTKIDLHPLEPGALRLTVKLVNEATFAQPYPDLQLTLTDRVGRVVGRRTFSPDHYLKEGQPNVLGSGELGAVLFDLAHPHEKAVGFEVDIVTRSVSS